MSEEYGIITNFEWIQNIKKRPKPSHIILSGYKGIDDACGGWRPGELYVVTGFTKCGKTLFCKSLTKHMHDQQEFPLWFSYEETEEQFLSGFPNMSEGLIFYMPRHIKPNSIKWMFDRIEEAIKLYNVRMVFIDHLHYLFDMSMLRNPSLAIGDYVRKIKRFAVQYNITIFLVCHTTKAKVDSEDDISYTSIRDSSFIAQESDCVFFVHRRTVSDGIVRATEAFVKVEFHRRTGAYGEIVRMVKGEHYLREVGAVLR